MFDKLITKIISKVTFKKRKKKEPSLIKSFMDHPELFRLEAFIENEEIIVKIKKKEEQKGES